MRSRQDPKHRKSVIVKQAKRLFHTRGFSQVDMADICKEVGVSRGGLYHYFTNKTAILDAIVCDEMALLAAKIDGPDVMPIVALLEVGSSHLGNEVGIVGALRSREDKLAYLTCSDEATAQILYPLLLRVMGRHVSDPAENEHVTELFLTINGHINRRVLLGDWSRDEGAGFAVTALKALTPFFRKPEYLTPIIQRLRDVSTQK